VNELFGEMAGMIGSDQAPVRREARQGELEHISLDTRRAERLLGWRHPVGLGEGFAGTIDWVRSTMNTPIG
jgi:nucleoside-diphosphate-sugar epimerase